MKVDFYTKAVLTACVLFLALIYLKSVHPTGYDCDACGWDVSRSATVCPQCGNPDPAYSDRQEEKEREAQRQRQRQRQEGDGPPATAPAFEDVEDVYESLDIGPTGDVEYQPAGTDTDDEPQPAETDSILGDLLEAIRPVPDVDPKREP